MKNFVLYAASRIISVATIPVLIVFTMSAKLGVIMVCASNYLSFRSGHIPPSGTWIRGTFWSAFRWTNS